MTRHDKAKNVIISIVSIKFMFSFRWMFERNKKTIGLKLNRNFLGGSSDQCEWKSVTNLTPIS